MVTFHSVYVQYQRIVAGIPCFQIFGRIPFVASVFEYHIHAVYLIKIKVLTNTSYQQQFRLYTDIHQPIAVSNCQIELARKDIILLSDTAVILYRASSRTSVEDRYINTRTIKIYGL